MGGVQFSSFYFIKELQKYPKVKIKLLLPRNGQFSKLCEKNFIPFSIYNSRKMYSSSIALFHDTIRIPNPFAWIHNSIHIYHNSKGLGEFSNIIKMRLSYLKDYTLILSLLLLNENYQIN